MKESPVHIKIKVAENVVEHLIVIHGEKIDVKRFITIILMKFTYMRNGNLGPFWRYIKP